MRPNIANSFVYRDLAMYIKSEAAQMALVQTGDAEAMYHLCRNANLHLSVAFAMLDYDEEASLPLLARSIYGSSSDVTVSNYKGEDIPGIDLEKYTVFDAILGSLDRFASVVESTMQKELDNLGVQGWSMFMQLYGTWDCSLADLIRNVKSILG